MAVFMPEARRGQNEISRLHRQALAFDCGKAATAFDDEPDGAGRVTVIGGVLARKDEL